MNRRNRENRVLCSLCNFLFKRFRVAGVAAERSPQTDCSLDDDGDRSFGDDGVLAEFAGAAEREMLPRAAGNRSADFNRDDHLGLAGDDLRFINGKSLGCVRFA